METREAEGMRKLVCCNGPLDGVEICIKSDRFDQMGINGWPMPVVIGEAAAIYRVKGRILEFVAPLV